MSEQGPRRPLSSPDAVAVGPYSHGVVAAIPIGYPAGRFGPVRRKPAEDKTHFDRW